MSCPDNKISFDSTSIYNALVFKAKNELKNIENSQSKIALLAIEACDIRHGGGSANPIYTLKDFALDIGVNAKTLSRWVVLQRDIIGDVEKEADPEKWRGAGQEYKKRKKEKEVINFLNSREKSKTKPTQEERDNFLNNQSTYEWIRLAYKLDSEKYSFDINNNNKKKLTDALCVLDRVGDWLNEALSDLKESEK